MKQLLFLLAVALFCGDAYAQTKIASSIRFNQAWVWSYQNDLIAVNEPGHKGELVVYHEPKLNYWLFTAEAYGTSGEMYNWILGKPDGTYTMCATDEFGKQTTAEQKLDFPLNRLLPQHYKATRMKKVFNINHLGFPKITGKAYNVDYIKTKDQSLVFVGEFKADFAPLYFFNRLNIEAKLPFQFPSDFPKNSLLLQDISIINKIKLKLIFKEISHAEYNIDLRIE